MLASLVLPALAALSFTAAQSVCISSPYASLACLTSDAAAATICSSAPNQTVTLTVTTTTLDVNTLSLTAHATSQVTVEETSIEKTTKTVTAGPTTTVTTTRTKLTKEDITLTTYVRVAARLAAASVDPACNATNAIVGLGMMSNDFLATACSCLGNPLPIISLTSTVTAAPVRTRTTNFAGTAPTTTLYKIKRRTFTETVAPITTMTLSTEVCITSTKTESYAAPIYTHVYGPKAGCADTASDQARRLDVSIDNFYNATQECKDMCTQESSCSFVWVQRLSSRGTEFFECSFNDHHLEEGEDLECGKEMGIYGAAIGLDACDRGTKEL